jgi:hypothetical protein
MKEIWIGLAEVESVGDEDALDGAKGAFVQVVGFADDSVEFRKLISTTLLEDGLSLLNVADSEPLFNRLESSYIVPEIANLVRQLSD